MNKIIFCDKNKELVAKVKEVIENNKNNLHCELIVDTSGDVLECKEKHPDAKIVTASNPKFDMGGGLDLILKTKYAEQCQTAREFKTTNDLFFVVSVDNDLKSTRKIIQRALLGVYFCSRKNDIILTGLGTGVGGLSSKDFIKELALFIQADFSSADFSRADFSGANFSRADFRWADFSGTKFDYRITPEEGSIIVWKKADNHIIKLKVDCKNISGGLVSRKLRTDKAEVLEIQNLDGTESGLTSIESNYDNNFRYDIGKTATVNNFVRDDKIDCDTGIHFFLTRDEAVRW